MATPFKLKRSSVPGKRPNINDLQRGELALNTFDGYLFTERDTSGVGIGTTVTLLTPWVETFGAQSIYYEKSVGIGTTNPTEKLDILGSLKVSDQLYVGGVSISGGVSIGEDITTRNLLASGISTFTGLVDVNGNVSINNGTGNVLDLNNGTLFGVGNIVINDPGPDEGIQWNGGNGWRIYEAPDSLANSGGNLQFNLGSGRLFTMRTDGSLSVPGIVTSTGLNVSGVSTFTAANTAAVVIRSGASGSYTALDIGRTGGEFSIGIAAGGGQFATDAVAGDVVIRSNVGKLLFNYLGGNASLAVAGSNVLVGTVSSTGTASQRLQVTGGAYVSGSLGIGATNPQYTLDFGKTSASTIRLISENNGTAIRVGPGGDSNDVTLLRVDGAGSYVNGQTNVGALGFSIKYMGSRSGNENSLSIFADDGATNATSPQIEAITIFQDGKVGINSTTPTEKLDVNGTTKTTQLNVTGVSTFGGNVYLGDADSLYFGNGNDLRILHNGTDSYIVDENQGNLYIGGSNEVIIANAALNETKAKFITNGAVELYYDNSKKFETTGAGATVFGTLQTQQLNVSGVVTATTFIGALTGTATTATKLATARTFEITGDVVASPISFDGTGNVSLAATIQPNSVALGSDTTGDYVRNITGTSNQITVTSGTGEGSTPTLSLPTNLVVPQDLTVTRDLQVNRNLNVTGNITIGGTSAFIDVQELRVFDPDIVLGFRTDAFGNDASNDNTANHGGVAIASTEGTPLVDLFIAGIETTPATYKKIMWFKEGTFAGLGTDAWLMNYAVGIGSTQFSSGTRLAAGAVQFTERDLAVVRNINASGVTTSTGGFVGNLTGNVTGNINSSGISTLGITTATNLTTQQLNVSGVVTATTFNGQINAGISTLGIATATNLNTQTLNVSGISTFTSISVGGTTGINQYVLTSTGTGLLWQSATSIPGVSGINITSDTSSSTSLYVPFVNVSAGTTALQYVSENQFVFKPSTGSLGIGTANPTAKLYVNGNVFVTGITTSTDFDSLSDQNLKTNVETISTPLEKIQKIRGVNFDWKETNRSSMGVIAQEIQKVFPQLVHGDETKTVNYNGLIGLLIECVKEQQKEIELLKEILKSDK